MKNNRSSESFNFINEPLEFNKFTEIGLLRYCLGATMYTPGTKDVYQKIKEKKWENLAVIVMCLEDSIAEEELLSAEKNVSDLLSKLALDIKDKVLSFDDIPLISIRVRNLEQFIRFSGNLSNEQLNMITAFNFPKFNSQNAEEYLSHLKNISQEHRINIYGMPILESKELAYIETRQIELERLKVVIDRYKDTILNIRVGGTDFSSYFGVRRNVSKTIYDLGTVKNILLDVLNFFSRENDYVVSAPVWEYFSVNREMKFNEKLLTKVTSSFKTNTTIIDAEVDGLIREVMLDIVNGFVGKTVIHPSHIKYVNSLHAVTKEEFDDANQIVSHFGGVIKSTKGNKMNEINPHMSWASKILMRSKAYGVIREEKDYQRLLFTRFEGKLRL